MGDKQETIADIVAEMRGRKEMLVNAISSAPLCYSVDDMKAKVEILDEFIDRIEAAQKMEVGNSAKMHEALVKVNGALDNIMDYDVDGVLHRCVSIIKQALAEPLRNCDKYTSLDEAQNVYMAINEMPEGNHDEDMRRWLCNFHNWLFASYESEVKK